jgi:hypothetical protein
VCTWPSPGGEQDEGHAESGSETAHAPLFHHGHRIEKALTTGKRLAALQRPSPLVSVVLAQALYGCEVRHLPLCPGWPPCLQRRSRWDSHVMEHIQRKSVDPEERRAPRAPETCREASAKSRWLTVKGCGLGVVCAGAQLQSEGLILVRIPVAGECTVGIPLTHEDSHASAGLEDLPGCGPLRGVRVTWSRRRSTGGGAGHLSTAREGAEAPLMLRWAPGWGARPRPDLADHDTTSRS